MSFPPIFLLLFISTTSSHILFPHFPGFNYNSSHLRYVFIFHQSFSSTFYTSFFVLIPLSTSSWSYFRCSLLSYSFQMHQSLKSSFAHLIRFHLTIYLLSPSFPPLRFSSPSTTASSVAVSAWTLVAISCERYYAIVHPLKSRRWQTLSHAYKLIALIWCGSLFCMSPIAVVSRLIPTSHGKYQSITYSASFPPPLLPCSFLISNVWTQTVCKMI